MTFDTDLHRRRLAVLFRLVLAIVPAIVLAAWTVLALPAVLVAWLATLVRGRTPRPLHRFLRGYVRYSAQVAAWWHLVSGRFPNPRRRDVHPVQLVVYRQVLHRRQESDFARLLRIQDVLRAADFHHGVAAFVDVGQHHADLVNQVRKPTE